MHPLSCPAASIRKSLASIKAPWWICSPRTPCLGRKRCARPQATSAKLLRSTAINQGTRWPRNPLLALDSRNFGTCTPYAARIPRILVPGNARIYPASAKVPSQIRDTLFLMRGHAREGASAPAPPCITPLHIFETARTKTVQQATLCA